MSAPSKAERFEAIVADYYEDMEQGRTTPQLDKLLARNPDLEEELRRFLDDVLAVQSRMRPLREAAGPTPLAQPFAIEPYVLGPTIGEGGMGIVIRAHDTHLRRDVAIKVMQASAIERPDLAQRFVAEAQILGQLEHPYIVPLHQLGKLPDGRPFLAMKLVQGRTLAELLRRRPSDPVELAEFLDRHLAIFTSVCQALAYAHRRGVIHRDLKPGNIMVGEHGEVQVMDWGLAKRLDTAESPALPRVNTLRDHADAWRSQSGDVLGTYAYMPPEQAAGKVDHLDERCDVFGLGAILCVILTGRPAYVAADLDTLRVLATEARLDDAWDRLDHCPADEAIRSIARQCLSIDPAGRPRDAAALADALERRRVQREQQARQRDRDLAAANARAQSERTRRRLAYGLAAAAVLLACSVLSGSWFYRQQAERQAELNRLETATAQSVEQSLDEAKALTQALKTARLADLDRLATDRLSLTRKADEAAQRGPASEAIQAKARQARDDAETELAALGCDRALMARLLEAQLPTSASTVLGEAAPKDPPPKDAGEFAKIDETFTAAFREWDAEFDASPQASARRIRARPDAIARELISGLDLWASLRRGADLAGAVRLLERANEADQPDARRTMLRGMLGEPALAGDRVRAIAKEIDAATEPTLNLVLLSRAAWKIGDPALAANLLRAAVLARPDDPLLRANLGTLSLMLGMRARLGASFGKDGDERSRFAAEATAHFQDAVVQCDALRTMRPETSLLFATALLSTPRNEEGLALLARIERERPNDAMVTLLKSFGLLRAGKLDEAAQAAAPLEGKKGIIDAGALQQLNLALSTRDWPKAEKIGRALVASVRYLDLLKSPDEKRRLSVHGKGPVADSLVLAYQGLGAALQKQDRTPEAMQAFGEASRIIQAIPSGHVYIAQQLLKAGDRAGAEGLLVNGWDEDAENAALLVYSVDYLRDQRKLAEADKLKQMLAKAKLPDDPPSLLKVGRRLLALDEFDLAEQALRRFRDAEPDDFLGAVEHATALMRLARFKDAEPVAEAVVKLRPESYLGHWLLGWSRFERKQHDRAEAPLRRAVERKADEPAPTIMLGANLRELKQLDEAEKLLRRGLDLDPRHAYACFALSEVLRDRGDLKAANEMYAKALKLKQGETP
jgi:serine/threonine protein kinase/Flp pilus assembly protein TadD